MKEQLTLVDKMDGNVDSISNRIANVRTWAYVSNKSNWVENQDYWIERTKNLEDKLSDRLHEELTKTFIDKRASVLAKGLKQDILLDTKIIDEEKVMINQQYIGHLKGLKLELDFKTELFANLTGIRWSKIDEQYIKKSLERKLGEYSRNSKDIKSESYVSLKGAERNMLSYQTRRDEKDVIDGYLDLNYFDFRNVSHLV